MSKTLPSLPVGDAVVQYYHQSKSSPCTGAYRSSVYMVLPGIAMCIVDGHCNQAQLTKYVFHKLLSHRASLQEKQIGRSHTKAASPTRPLCTQSHMAPLCLKIITWYKHDMCVPGTVDTESCQQTCVLMRARRHVAPRCRQYVDIQIHNNKKRIPCHMQIHFSLTDSGIYMKTRYIELHSWRRICVMADALHQNMARYIQSPSMALFDEALKVTT